jgi:predicted transcriptional regulator
MRQKCKTYRTCECKLPADCTKQANKDDIIAAVERQPQRSSHDIARELGLSPNRVLNLLHDNELHSYHYL